MSTDYRLGRQTFSHKICNRCNLGIIESIHHLVMQCPFYSDEGDKMYEQLKALENETVGWILEDAQAHSTYSWESSMSSHHFSQWLKYGRSLVAISVTHTYVPWPDINTCKLELHLPLTNSSGPSSGVLNSPTRLCRVRKPNTEHLTHILSTVKSS